MGAFDTGKSALTKHNLALSYSGGDMIIHATANAKKEFGGGVYLKNSPSLETGVTMSAGGGSSSFAIGTKYALGPDASLRAKVNNTCQIGLSYQQKLRDGITVPLSTNLDGTKLNEPGHKLGVCLEMAAQRVDCNSTAVMYCNAVLYCIVLYCSTAYCSMKTALETLRPSQGLICGLIISFLFGSPVPVSGV